jgi:hypothetical protein
MFCFAEMPFTGRLEVNLIMKNAAGNFVYYVTERQQPLHSVSSRCLETFQNPSYLPHTESWGAIRILSKGVATNFLGRGGNQNICLHFTGLCLNYVGSEVLTTVVMKNAIFWDIMSCSPLKVN